MISYDEALAIIAKVKVPLGTERLPLAAAAGRTLAADLHARVPSPPFTNSAMDGYAFRRDDFAGLGETSGPHPVVGTLYARPVDPAQLPAHRPGSVVRIMTGAYLPAWADTVIPVEDTDGGETAVRFKALPPAGTNLRRQGEDVAEGAPLLKAGTKLEPERIMVAAAFGYRELDVAGRPELVFFSTGDELVEPGEPLPPGGVYNSSKYFLGAAARAVGYPDAPHRTLVDDEDKAADAVRALLGGGKPTVLVTTGAVSAGELDFIPRVGARLGFDALFHKVAIRPGKPVYLAVKDRVVWLGLPGNAISTCVGWHIFVRPLLTAVAGLPPAPRRTLVLKNEVTKPEGLRCFFRAEVNGNQAWVAKRQGSAQLAASMTNEAYVELPEGKSRVPAETRVEAIIV